MENIGSLHHVVLQVKIYYCTKGSFKIHI